MIEVVKNAHSSRKHHYHHRSHRRHGSRKATDDKHAGRARTGNHKRGREIYREMSDTSQHPSLESSSADIMKRAEDDLWGELDMKYPEMATIPRQIV